MSSKPKKESMEITIKTIEEIIKPLERKDDFSDFLNRGVPPRFSGALITDEQIVSFMKEYFSFENGKGAYIYGECGTGKTRNLYGIYRTLRANIYWNLKNLTQDNEKYSIEGRRVVEKGENSIRTVYTFPEIEVINISEFFSDLKQSFDDDNSEQQIQDAIKTRDILLIDDFGVEKLSDWVIEITYRLINHRYEYMKPTFFSSNLSLKELADRVGDRFASRIAEMCKIIKIEGEDKRLTRP